MATLSITKRVTASGPRYDVRFRRGGSDFPVERGGSFKTLKEAKIRRDFIGRLLAAGQDPRPHLTAKPDPVVLKTTLSQWGEKFIDSRIDVTRGTLSNYRIHLLTFNETFGSREPEAITPEDVSAFVASSTLKPSSLRQYMGTLRQVLDYAGCSPNPARDKRVRLPKIESEEKNPPTAWQFKSILAAVSAKWRLAIVLLEQTGMRVNEVATLTWGDVDFGFSHVRVTKARSKTGKARWVKVPEKLLDEISGLLPVEDRGPDRPVFVGATKDVLSSAMYRACKTAQVGSFSPHDLRHRRASLRVGLRDLPIALVSEHLGHTRTSMTLDTYTHVLMDLSEVDLDEALAIVRDEELVTAAEGSRVSS
jgi:integrase